MASVLDSFALLAFLRGESGEEQVAALLEKAGARDVPLLMTEVNYAEVKYMVLRKDGPERWADVARELPALPIEFHPGDRRLADSAADFKSRHKLSLGEAFAAALAKEKKGRPRHRRPRIQVRRKRDQDHLAEIACERQRGSG